MKQAQPTLKQHLALYPPGNKHTTVLLFFQPPHTPIPHSHTLGTTCIVTFEDMYIKCFPSPNTLRLSSCSLSPALFLAMQVYSPSSSLATSIIVISEPSSLKLYFSPASRSASFLGGAQVLNIIPFSPINSYSLTSPFKSPSVKKHNCFFRVIPMSLENKQCFLLSWLRFVKDQVMKEKWAKEKPWDNILRAELVFI